MLCKRTEAVWEGQAVEGLGVVDSREDTAGPIVLEVLKNPLPDVYQLRERERERETERKT